ncbi:hypothetical protein HOO65_090222 [Ceratocystis lukuohia]|uniref:Uncharacterized protein n=1 Tax=Ceratocystis lukuohia TaxID=2019550 RepID=A0ABR4M9H5_9PEZI
MRPFSTLLPFVLSLLSLSEATILEDHGYKVRSNGQFDGVFLPDGHGKDVLAYGLGFYPLNRAVAFHFVGHNLERERGNKLDLSQIYKPLAEAREWEPEDLDWIVYDTASDQPNFELLREIRNNRDLNRMEEVCIKPGEMGWNEIAETTDFQNAVTIKSSLPDIICIKTTQRTDGDTLYNVDSLYFHFSEPKARSPKDKTSPSATDKQTEDSRSNQEEEWKTMWETEVLDGAALRALFGEEEQ